MLNRRLYLNILALAVLLLLTAGCEKNGKIRILNRTSHPAYAGIFANTYTIDGGEALTVGVTTGRQTPFNPDVGVWVEVFLAGETFQIYDEYLQTYVDKTSVWVRAGETTSIYLDPNRASVKVVNQSDMNIKKIIVQRSTYTNIWTDEHIVFLIPDDEWFIQVPPATTQSPYHYTVQIVFENDSILTYGGPNNILYADDQFLVEVL